MINCGWEFTITNFLLFPMGFDVNLQIIKAGKGLLANAACGPVVKFY